jgi:sodium/proline symporter
MHQAPIAVYFILFLIFFAVIGIMSLTKRQKTTEDYLVASKNISPWLVGLSAVATNNSGYMFIGMIGYTYMAGLSSMWLAIGWVFGDYLASTFIHARLRIASEKRNAHSFGALIGSWQQPHFYKLQRLVGLITLVFLSVYSAAQLNAGSKALHVLFDWHYAIGAVIGAIIVLLYCYAGGIRASIWTDVAQSSVMIIAMCLLLAFGIHKAGGLNQSFADMNNISTDYLNIFPQNLMFGPIFGPILFVVSWVFAGFGVIGQPHIMIRFMAIEKPEQINRARFYYYLWYTSFFTLTICVGLITRLLIKETNFDAELALPMLAQQLFSPFFVGLVLAALFAATISTADSQILSCSAAVTKDINQKDISYSKTKIVTIAVTMFSLGIALLGNKSVFVVVVYAWAVLSAAFAPLLTLFALNKQVSEKTACSMVIIGPLAAVIWHQYSIANTIYSVMPGMIAGFIVYILSRLFKKN